MAVCRAQHRLLLAGLTAPGCGGARLFSAPLPGGGLGLLSQWQAACGTRCSSSSSSSSSSGGGGGGGGSGGVDADPGKQPSAHESGASRTVAGGEGHRVVYEGFFARPHKRLKYASLLNTFASFAAAPLIVTYSSASPIARVAVSASVLAFAIITTGGLHWFTSPYVHQLLHDSKADTARVQTLGFFGGSRWRQFPVSSARPPTGYHPLASFQAEGKTYYVDRGNFADKALLARLGVAEAGGGNEPQADGHAHEPAQQQQQQAVVQQQQEHQKQEHQQQDGLRSKQD